MKSWKTGRMVDYRQGNADISSPGTAMFMDISYFQ